MQHIALVGELLSIVACTQGPEVLSSLGTMVCKQLNFLRKTGTYLELDAADWFFVAGELHEHARVLRVTIFDREETSSHRVAGLVRRIFAYFRKALRP